MRTEFRNARVSRKLRSSSIRMVLLRVFSIGEHFNTMLVSGTLILI